MFTRIIYGDSTAIFTVVAFGVAASIFITISWRALLMKRPQVERYENLPFLTATPTCAEAGQDGQAKCEATPQLRT